MSVNLDQIDELRKRGNCSYQEAKEALEISNGDMVEALVYLEKQHKVKEDKGTSIYDKIKALITKGNETKFVVKKKDNIVLSLPVTLTLIIAIFTFYISIFVVILASITGHRFMIVSNDVDYSKVNSSLNKVSDVVDKTKKKFLENETTDSSNEN